MNSFVDSPEALKPYLAKTYYLDFNHPTIKKTIDSVIKGLSTKKEQAIAIHNFVRDNIKFGFTGSFYDMKASQVLAAGVGFCNNQATLFAAMLKGAGIPARHRFYSLSAKILDNIVNPGTDFVDHAVIEVFLNGKWIAVDSYIVDLELAKNAKQRLDAPLGVGIRFDCESQWDGENSSFSQFHPDYIEKEFGEFADVGEFYQKTKRPNNYFGFFTRIIFPFSASKANKNIKLIRNNK